MATLAPIPTAKRQRLNAAAESKRVAALVDEGKLNPTTDNVIIQLQSSVDGETLGPSISLPAGNTGQRELQMIVNQLRRQSRAGKKRRVDDGSESQEEDYDDDDDEDLPFAFHLDVSTSEGTSTQPTRLDITTSISQDVLQAAFARKLDLSAEDTLRIVFEPQAVFKVRPVRRCSNTLSGE
jgi:ribosome assembly protein 4